MCVCVSCVCMSVCVIIVYLIQYLWIFSCNGLFQNVSKKPCGVIGIQARTCIRRVQVICSTGTCTDVSSEIDHRYGCQFKINAPKMLDMKMIFKRK